MFSIIIQKFFLIWAHGKPLGVALLQAPVLQPSHLSQKHQFAGRNGFENQHCTTMGSYSMTVGYPERLHLPSLSIASGWDTWIRINL